MSMRERMDVPMDNLPKFGVMPDKDPERTTQSKAQMASDAHLFPGEVQSRYQNIEVKGEAICDTGNEFQKVFCGHCGSLVLVSSHKLWESPRVFAFEDLQVEAMAVETLAEYQEDSVVLLEQQQAHPIVVNSGEGVELQHWLGCPECHIIVGMKPECERDSSSVRILLFLSSITRAPELAEIFNKSPDELMNIIKT